MVIGAGRAAVLLSMVAAPSLARAEPAAPRVELRWNAPRDCPDALGLVRGVEDFLGQSLAHAGEQHIAIDARVQGDAAHGYAAKLSFVTEQSTTERDLEHPDCSKLTEGVALLVALAIDPERVRARQEGKEAKSPVEPVVETRPAPVSEPLPTTPAPAPTVDRLPAPRAEDRRRAPRPLRPSVALFGLAGDGLLPSVAPGLGLELGLSLRGLEAALVARSWASRSAAVPGVDRASVEVSLVTAGLRVCGAPSHQSWSLLVCARGDLGRMSGIGEYVDDARARTDGFAAVGGGLGVAYTSGRFSPRAGAEVLWTASRARFGILRNGNEVEAFEPRAWQLTGFVGLAYLL